MFDINAGNISEDRIRQMNYLQKVLGNQRVAELVKAGVITTDADSLSPMASMKQDMVQKDLEKQQILTDREALMPAVIKETKKLTEDAARLSEKFPGKELFVNVVLDLHYVQIPGQDTGEFYHFSELESVDISTKNIENTGKARPVTRGSVVPVTFSFLYEAPAGIKKQEEEVEETSEETLQEEELKTEEEITPEE